MKFEQLGVIAFFGILIPGAYLTTFFILAFACILELSGLQGHAEIFSFMSQHSLLSSTAFFFVSYLFGVILRLLPAPTIADKMSNYIPGQKTKDNFPYQETLLSDLEPLGMSQVTDLIADLNKKYGKEDNVEFFNYCKLIIEANNETIAKHIRQNEARVRFLAGTVFALIASCFVGLCFSFIFLFTPQFPFFQRLYIVLTLLSLVILVLILWRFKHPRKMEVQALWMSIYLLLKGGIPNSLGIEPSELMKRIAMERDPASIPHGSSSDAQTVE